MEFRNLHYWTELTGFFDRFLNLGCPDRSLSTEEPVNSTILPIDDASWDQGV